MEHRHRRGGRSVAVGRPSVEREHGAKHTEAHKCEREQHALPTVGYGIVVGNLKDVHSEAAVGARVVVDADDAEHQEGRATHEHQRKLHGRVVLVATAPHANQQIHGDERDLVEHEHGEQVDGYEEAEHACRQQIEPKEELLGQRIDFPRGEHAGKHDEGRKQYHDHRHAIDAKRKVDVERSIPADVGAQKHLAGVASAARLQEVGHQIECHGHKHCGAGERNGTDGFDTLIAAQSQASESEQRHYHKVDQYIIENHNRMLLIY